MLMNSSKNMQNKKIFLTGATSGIGFSIAKIYLKNNWKVIGLGRNLDNLLELKKEYPDKLDIYQIELLNFENSKKLIKDIFINHQDIDTFILNAGIYIPDTFKEINFENSKKTFETNVLINYLILEILKENITIQKHHTIGIVSSVAGYRGLARSITYGPTKAALINLAESLKIELNCNVKLINPGFVDTPATKINKFKMPFIIPPEVAAQAIFEKIYKAGFEISFPFPFNFMMKFASILPYNLYFKIAKKFQ